MAIYGSIEWRIMTDIVDERAAKRHIRGYLRYAIKPDPTLTRLVVRGDVNDRVLSRCEVVKAWQLLPEEYKWIVYDRIVKQRPPWEVAIAHKIAERTVRWRVERAIEMMLEKIVEPLPE